MQTGSRWLLRSSLTLAVASSSAASQQEVIRSWEVPAATLDTLEDADGDGVVELLAGNRGFSVPGRSGCGRVVCLRGASSSIEPVFQLVGSVAGQGLGWVLESIGDVDGDRYGDFVVRGLEGPMLVCDGRKGAILFSSALRAESVADLGDVNDDGLADFLVGLPGAGGAGQAILHLGGEFTIRLHLVGPAHSVYYGESLAALDDVSGDGVPDFAVGAPGGAGPHDANPGYVFVHSGATGELLYELEGEGAAGHFGRDIVAVSDRSGDGLRDLVVGSFECCGGVPKDGGPGRVYLFDGSSGAVIAIIDPPPSTTSFGLHVDSAGDLDGDGHPDFLVDLRGFVLDSVRAIEGGSFVALFDLPSASAFAGGGSDWNDDGFPDVLHARDTVRLYSGAPPGVRALGRPCAAARGSTLPRVGATGEPRIGARYPLHLSEVVPDVDVDLLAGGPRRVARAGAPSCSLLADPLVVFRTRTTRIGPGRGAATVELPIPNDPALIGASFLVQWRVHDTAGRPAALTRALELTLAGP